MTQFENKARKKHFHCHTFFFQGVLCFAETISSKVTLRSFKAFRICFVSVKFPIFQGLKHLWDAFRPREMEQIYCQCIARSYERQSCPLSSTDNTKSSILQQSLAINTILSSSRIYSFYKSTHPRAHISNHNSTKQPYQTLNHNQCVSNFRSSWRSPPPL